MHQNGLISIRRLNFVNSGIVLAVVLKNTPMPSTVLILEDENKFRGLLSRIIEVEGYTVLQAQSSRAGLKLLETEDIRVVISDVKLPDGNGVDLVKRIKEMRPYVEVINLTA